MNFIVEAWKGRTDIEIGEPLFLEGDEFLGNIVAWDPVAGMVSIAETYAYRYVRGKNVTLARYKGALRQLIDVLAAGFDYVKGDADGFRDLVDIDRCPKEFLPHLAALFGFEFPFDLSEEQQRSYLHTIISMYRTKGTAWTLRLAALRIIGSGFDLEVANEDHVGKTFDVVLTAQGDGATTQLEQKLEFMVEQYSPAGMIPSIRIIYYFTEVADSTRAEDGTSSSVAFNAWRFNYVGHTLNGSIRLNDYGQTPLSF